MAVPILTATCVRLLFLANGILLREPSHPIAERFPESLIKLDGPVSLIPADCHHTVESRYRERPRTAISFDSSNAGPSGRGLGKACFCKRQFPDALAGRSKNRAVQCRRKRRQPRVANSRTRRIARHDVHVSFPGRIVHPRHLKPIEIGLINHAVGLRDLSVEAVARSLYSRYFKLLFHRL